MTFKLCFENLATLSNHEPLTNLNNFHLDCFDKSL